VIAQLQGVVLAAGTNDPDLVRACGPKSEQSSACTLVYRVTGSDRAAEVADALAKPIRIVVILLVAWILVRISRRIVGRFVRRASGSVERLSDRLPGRVSLVDTGPMPAARRAQRAETVGLVLRSIVAIIIWSVAVLTVLSELGVNLAPLLAGAGIIGVALGFGAQSLVRDFLTGLFMLLEDQYNVGDEIDLGLANGTVEGVSLRTTRLRDLDGVVWHVPNGEVHRVGNKSRQWGRALVDVAIAYDADLARATDVIHEVARDAAGDPVFDDRLLGEPEVLGVESVTPDRVVLRIVARTRPQQQALVERELRLRVKTALDETGIAAPPPA
jgi:moderate conductance mechanosensitive channel